MYEELYQESLFGGLEVLNVSKKFYYKDASTVEDTDLCRAWSDTVQIFLHKAIEKYAGDRITVREAWEEVVSLMLEKRRTRKKEKKTWQNSV
jgi:hypothetical protein